MPWAPRRASSWWRRGGGGRPRRPARAAARRRRRRAPRRRRPRRRRCSSPTRGCARRVLRRRRARAVRARAEVCEPGGEHRHGARRRRHRRAAAAGARWLRPRRCCWMAPSVGLRPVPGEKWPAGHGGADAVSEAPAAGAGAAACRARLALPTARGSALGSPHRGRSAAARTIARPTAASRARVHRRARGERRRCLSVGRDPALRRTPPRRPAPKLPRVAAAAALAGPMIHRATAAGRRRCSASPPTQRGAEGSKSGPTGRIKP